jgi:hypothetical protein
MMTLAKISVFDPHSGLQDYKSRTRTRCLAGARSVTIYG